MSINNQKTGTFRVKKDTTFYKIKDGQEPRLADLVAMSAGFPLAFNSKKLDLVPHTEQSKENISYTSYLGDGGMLENLGLGLMLSRLAQKEKQNKEAIKSLDLILVAPEKFVFQAG